MISLFLCLADAPVLVVPRTVFADGRIVTSESRLAWPDDAVVRIEDRDGELVARFDRPIAPARLAAFREAAGDAIGDLRWNDDSLVLRPAAGWTMRWRQTRPGRRARLLTARGRLAARNRRRQRVRRRTGCNRGGRGRRLSGIGSARCDEAWHIAIRPTDAPPACSPTRVSPRATSAAQLAGTARSRRTT
ncbi:hypothetical protein QP185_19435 [Sphingomonas aerolata]|uniref:hypothetical protein n=1 Tax=Sphingomonas aerolata TaxID=185951 RepID=UPI002FE373CA